MVTYRANIAIANKYKCAYGLSIGLFTFDFGPFQSEGQGHAYFDSEYLTNGDR